MRVSQSDIRSLLYPKETKTSNANLQAVIHAAIRPVLPTEDYINSSLDRLKLIPESS